MRRNRMAAPVTFSEHAEKVLVFNGRHPLVAEHLAEMGRQYEDALLMRDAADACAGLLRADADRAEAALAAAQEALHQLVGFENSGSMQKSTILTYLPTLRVIVDNARSALPWAAAGGDETA